MKQANIKILSDENKRLLDSHLIDCYTLNNSKANELAFASNNHRSREFEVKFMADGSYRLSTRYLGYKTVMESFAPGFVEKIKDPDGRRYSFRVSVYDDTELNELIYKMLLEGYDPRPKTESV